MASSAVLIAVSLGLVAVHGGCLPPQPSTPVAQPDDPHRFVTDVHLTGEAITMSRCELVYGFSPSLFPSFAGGEDDGAIDVATRGCETIEVPLPPGIDPGADRGGDLDAPPPPPARRP